MILSRSGPFAGAGPTLGFWVLWALALIGFPTGGLLTKIAVGPVATPLRAGLAGVITGVVVGIGQWFVLRTRLPIPAWWVLATGAGMGMGMALSTLALGTEMRRNQLLVRAFITGFIVGGAQWLLLRQILPQSALWIPVVAAGWTIGWAVTRGAGVGLSAKWAVFGVTGALAFQLVSGLALSYLLRNA